MPKYMLTALDASGRKFTQEVEASSADDAVQNLSSLGCSEIVLHSDDVMGHLEDQYPQRQRAKIREAFSAEELVKLRSLRGFRYVLFMLGKGFRKTWYYDLAVLVFMGWRLIDGTLTTFWIIFAVFWVLIHLVFVGFLFIGGSAKIYDTLMHAVAWARWEEVLELLSRHEKRLRLVPRFELAIRKAQALAGLGQLESAIDGLKPFENDLKVPAWMYWGRHAEVYSAARDYNNAIESLEYAAELAPDNPTVLLDLSGSLLRRRRDKAGAAMLLAEAKKHAIPDLLRFAVSMMEGGIALENGDDSAAKDHLERSLKESSLVRVSPLFAKIESDILAYLAIACGRLGEFDAAHRHFQRAEKMLRAHQQEELIARCVQAIGNV